MMTTDGPWMAEFVDRGETHAFYNRQYKVSKVRTDFDPSKQVACSGCGRTCVKMELLANDLGWIRVESGWLCSMCKGEIDGPGEELPELQI